MTLKKEVTKMPDKKPTDNEIIIDLRNYLENRECAYCGREDEELTKILNDALDLINRLQVENSNLTSDLTSLQNDLTSAKAENKSLWSDFLASVAKDKEIQLLQAKKFIEDIEITIKNIKIKAYNEFAEALNKEIEFGMFSSCYFRNKIQKLLNQFIQGGN